MLKTQKPAPVPEQSVAIIPESAVALILELHQLYQILK